MKLNFYRRIMRGFCLLQTLAVVLCGVTCRATDPLYQNIFDSEYIIPNNPPPLIDATAFDNENIFSITYDESFSGNVFYEPMNTLFYTNNATMIINAPFGNGVNNYVVGYRFDTQTTNQHFQADTFYNAGDIRCDSAVDGNLVYDFGGATYQLNIGRCLVSATNIISPGSIGVSLNGLIKFNGQDVDLSRGTFNVEGAGQNTANYYAIGDFGVDTNNEWNPASDLTANTAQSSYPFVIVLPNSTAYFQSPVQQNGPSNLVYRAIFIEDFGSPNVTHNVYFGPSSVGTGEATVEWVGPYIDAATGLTVSNYLYLNDDYALGASSNVFLTGTGYPNNFTFAQSTTPLNVGTLSAAGFSPVFPNVYLTNNYSYLSAELISSTTTTNRTTVNPSGAITNLPGRIEIDASDDLDLSYSTITGPNYVSIHSPHQFEGSAGAQIMAPYADINLGVTNGFLIVSNLMQVTIPNWSGLLAAWSTRFIVVDSTGVTNDFRVMIVGSLLNPTTLGYVQDLILHATNSVVISDAYNVLRNLSIDAQNLTLTTNGAGVGAASLDGELNLLGNGVSIPNSLPNLRNLTNSGAISTIGLGQFYANSNAIASSPSMPAVPAIGTLSALSSKTNVAAGDTVTIGTKTYKFVSTLNNLVANQVKRAGTVDGSLSNLVAAINHAAGSGTKYSKPTAANLQVSAGSVSNHSFLVTARVAGASGNTNSTTTTSKRLTWNGHLTLFGGANATLGFTNSIAVTVPYLNFINNGLLADQGSIILANYFESGGIITNGTGSFSLKSQNVVLTNGAIYAGGDISIAADTLVTSNLFMEAGRSLVLQVTNLLTDTGTTNGNVWLLNWTTGNSGNGLIVPVKPPIGDLLGTTIYDFVPGPAKMVQNIWPGVDMGAVTTGYNNNLGIGSLVLDSAGTSSTFAYKGVGVSNAMYVGYLELWDQATNRDSNGNFTTFSFGTNMVIYYGKATMPQVNNADVSFIMNHRNGNRLQWIPSFTNVFNSSLSLGSAAVSKVNSQTDITVKNSSVINPVPTFTASDIQFQTLGVTNLPPLSVILQWNSIPGATNLVYCSNDGIGPLSQLVTNFVTSGSGTGFITNVIYDPIISSSRFYNVTVIPPSP